MRKGGGIAMILKYELYKIFSKKSILIFFLVSIAIILLRNYSHDKMMISSERNKESQTVLYIETVNKLNGKEKYKKEEVEQKLLTLKNEGKEDFFEYKNLQKALKMRNNLSLTTFNKLDGLAIVVVKEPWQAFLVTLCLIFGLTSIFSGDHDKNTFPTIRSCKYGTKTLMYNKILTIVAYSIITYLALILFPDIIIMLIKGVNAADASIISNQWFQGSLFPYNMKEMYIYLQGYLFLGVLSLAFFIAVVSLWIKNTTGSVFLTLVLLVFPFFIPRNISVWTYVENFNFTSIMTSYTLFNRYKTFNIFNQVVMYKDFVAVVFGLVLICMGGILFRFRRAK